MEVDLSHAKIADQKRLLSEVQTLSLPIYIIYLSFRELELADTKAKGQLILKLLFGVFKFFQKTNKNKST